MLKKQTTSTGYMVKRVVATAAAKAREMTKPSNIARETIKGLPSAAKKVLTYPFKKVGEMVKKGIKTQQGFGKETSEQKDWFRVVRGELKKEDFRQKYPNSSFLLLK